MKGRWVFLVAGIAAYGVIAVYGDPFLVGVFLAPAGWVLAAAGAAIVLASLACSVTGRGSSRPLLLFFSAVAAVGGLLAALGPLNEGIQEKAVAAAKAYPDLVAPLLEQYRQQHGAYPRSLDELPSRPPVPRLLRARGGYGSDGAQYYFSFGQPGGLIDVWGYSSKTRKWHLST